MSHAFMLAYTDVIRLTIILALWFYVNKLETIKCPRLPSWKPTFIKYYAVIMIALIVVSMMSSPYVMTHGLLTSVLSVLNIVLIYAVFTYVREIEDDFKSCQIGRLDMNFHLVHEFLKLYSLIMVLLIVFMILAVISSGLAMMPIPKYEAMAHDMFLAKMHNEQLKAIKAMDPDSHPRFHRRSHKPRHR